MVTFIVSHYLYAHENVFMTYRWQIAAGLITPIAVIDFKKHIIPNKLLLIGLVFSVVAITSEVIFSMDYILSILGNSLIGMFCSGGIFFISSLLVKNSIGAGDIKMFLLLGFLLAIRGVFNVLLYSMIISALTAIVFLISGKKTSKDELPLAPFAFIGIAISIFFGV